MAKPKKVEREFNFRNSLRKMKEEAEAKPLIATTVYVVEIQDPYDDMDDRYQSGYRKVVSPYFDSRKYDDPQAEAEKWIEDHDPDGVTNWGAKPTYFKIERQYLRTHVENKWGPM